LGINAQLITPSGCAGRLGSLVTDADLGNSPLVQATELCLHKRGAKCLACVKRCPVKAVTETGIQRRRCWQRLSLLLVDRSPGVETEYRYGLMGCRGGGTGRLVFRDVKVPKENLVGDLHGGALCFHQMMIPERLTSAAGCLGVWGALDLAVRYADRRRAFGRPIRHHQAVSFKVADAITQLDAARALTYMAARAVDEDYPNVRRVVSEAKKFTTEAAWEIVNSAMQIMGGIGYTDVYPLERTLRDIRLGMIWTGTSEIMSLLIQHEYYNQVLDPGYNRRKMEDDAMHPDESERCFSDDDMQRLFEAKHP
jgi:acyl-CoA dehydrogenase